MRINGVELPLDLYDLETAGRVQKALCNLSQELGALERKDVDVYKRQSGYCSEYLYHCP